MRTLVLLRHGKSAYPDGVGDHERPLNDRGQSQAALAGHRLRASLTSTGSSGGAVDLAVVSSATRAQQTWQQVAPHLRVHHDMTSPDLYLADLQTLALLVHDLDAGVRTVLLVGHNEGLEDFAGLLSGEHVTLKTSSYALLHSDLEWSAWARGSATLSEVVTAR